MVTAPAVIHGDRERLLGFDAVEHPVALQLGGSDPAQLAEAARIGEAYGYDEINLNVGCPSDRVQSGRFGACLMREPELVADCMAAIEAAVQRPRHGEMPHRRRRPGPGGEPVRHWSTPARGGGVTPFVVHARKAWLKGLSPKENRDVPPLDYAAGAAAEARAAASDHRASTAASAIAGRGRGASGRRRRAGRGDAGPRRLSRAGDPGAGRPPHLRRWTSRTSIPSPPSSAIAPTWPGGWPRARIWRP